jgi:O-antigen ligase
MAAAAGLSASGVETAAALARLARTILFVAAFLLFWVSVNPFHDLANSAALTPSDASNLLNQAAVITVALGAMTFVACQGWRQFVPLISVPLVLTLAGIAMSVLLSSQFDLSIRRFVLALLVIVIAGACLRLPEDRRHLAGLLTIGACTVLIACYMGLVLAPQLAIHHAGEALEPEHAGSWRGLFIHKNQAGAAMGLLTFFGIFIARARNVLLGGAIVAASVVFLLFTQSKGAVGMLTFALVLSAVVWRIRHTGLRLVIVLGGVGAFTLLTVGSVVIGPVRDLLEKIASDPTFTNRDDIWRFAIEQTMARPLFGHGFEAFWRTHAVVYSGSSIENWAATTTDAHNGYLNIAVTSGIVTLAFAVIWLLVQPILDLGESQRSGNDPAVGLLFVQIWLFCIFYACLETVFFTGGGPVWLTLLMAVLGLRLHAKQQVLR